MSAEQAYQTAAGNLIKDRSARDSEFADCVREVQSEFALKGVAPTPEDVLLAADKRWKWRKEFRAARVDEKPPAPAREATEAPRTPRVTVSVFEASDLVRFRVHETVVTILPMPGFDLPAFTRWRKSRYHSGGIHLWETVGLYAPRSTEYSRGTRYFRNSLDLANLLPITVTDAIKLDPNRKEGVTDE